MDEQAEDKGRAWPKKGKIRIFNIRNRQQVMTGEKRFKIQYLTLCIRGIPKQVLLQTVKTQVKCLMPYFIRIYTDCKGKKDLQTKECNIFFLISI